MMDIIVVPMLGAASDKWPLNLSVFRRLVKDAGLSCAPAVNTEQSVDDKAFSVEREQSDTRRCSG
jgi:hypothetical protein